MTVADYVVKFLAARGVTHVFELSGGMITPLLDSVARAQTPKLVDMRHEQAAGFAAEGMARMTGRPGVAFATSGPGATNLLTAIGSCYFDSVPAVFITGNVPTSERKGPGRQRQRGFQETDIVAMAAPVTKAAWRVTNPNVFATSDFLAMTFDVASRGRPGPVLIDIPFDVLRAKIPEPEFTERVYPPAEVEPADLDAVIEMFSKASRPLVLVGGGVRAADAAGRCRRALNHLWVPTVHSLMGLDVTYPGHPLRVGMIGSYGNRWANWALAQADALLVLGSRLDIRQTGSDAEGFARGKQIIQVEIDESEVRQRVPVARHIHADLGPFCAALAEHGPKPGGTNAYGFTTAEWTRQIAAMELQHPAAAESNAPAGSVNPNAFLADLGRIFEDASAFVLDVGAHQMWAAQSLRFLPTQRVLTSGGMGAMGFALPAAIGACLADSARRDVVVITGDGSLQVNIQELQTIAALNLPIKIVVMNNYGHGMVRQFQAEQYAGRLAGTIPAPPSFTAIADAYRIAAVGSELVPIVGLDWLARESRPKLLEVIVSPETGVFPKLRFGHGLDAMEGKP